MNNCIFRFAFALFLIAATAGAANAQTSGNLQLVLVIDGLRPDSISAAETPNLERLRREGVNFQHTHAVFPTVTRVNSASLATGTYPARHGIMGNSIFVPAVDPLRAFTNDDFQPLLKLDEVTGGNMTTTPGIAELLAQNGRRVVTVSSGSTGSAILLAAKAHRGTGTVINGDFFPGSQVAYPESVSKTILEKFGPAPKKGGATDRYDSAVDWSMEVLREYVLPTLRPDVAFVWMTEPDHIQHGLGAGHPDALAAIRNNDRQIGLLLDKLGALGLRDKTNIMVVSDHGFAQTVANANVGTALTAAGLMPAAPSDDVVIASSGQAVALHVKDRNPEKIAAIVSFLQKQPWCGVVFTAERRGGAAHEGTASGSFSLEFVHLGGHARSPDIVFTFPWTSALNRHGVPGTEYNLVSGNTPTGAIDTATAGHGGIGPWTIRNTMLAWGPGFKKRSSVRTPTSNVDVTPTLLHLLGLPQVAAQMDGRAISEAIVGGPDEEQIAIETRTLRVESGVYRAVMQISETNGKRYIDKAWREP